MRVIVDVMSGDNAPLALLEGVRMASEGCDASFTLVGDSDVIKRVSSEIGLDLSCIELVHTTSVVTMEDDPIDAFKHKKDSSMMLGMKLLSEGKGDAFVSAGNTGALFTGATFIVKRLPGVSRAAIGTVIPGKEPFLLVDAGANISVKPEHLEQFAIMGTVYMNRLYHIDEPLVGLLNNGTEECKGTTLQTETNEVLSACGAIRYVGSVEGTAAMFGGCHVLVTDGFTGNIFLKAIEGVSRLILDRFNDAFAQSGLLDKLPENVLGALTNTKHDFDPAEHGGSPIIGISRPVIKAHGSSNATAIKNAIFEAIEYCESGISSIISEEMLKLTDRN